MLFFAGATATRAAGAGAESAADLTSEVRPTQSCRGSSLKGPGIFGVVPAITRVSGPS